VRALTAVRLLYGSVLLLAPGAVLHELPHGRVDWRALAVARVLGARHLLQAAVVGHGSERWLRAGAVVDAGHAATMVALAALRPERRALAGANALVAASLAAGGIVESRRGRYELGGRGQQLPRCSGMSASRNGNEERRAWR
jgi:hypothetical protein